MGRRERGRVVLLKNQTAIALLTQEIIPSAAPNAWVAQVLDPIPFKGVPFRELAQPEDAVSCSIFVEPS